MGTCNCGQNKNLLITSEVIVPSQDDSTNAKVLKVVRSLPKNVTDKIIGEPKKQAKNLLKISLVNNRSSLSSILNEINQELLDKTLSNNQTDITVSDFQKERFNSIKNKRAHLMRQLSEKHNDSSVGKSRRNNKDNVQETEHRNCKSPPINRSKTTLCKKEESKTSEIEQCENDNKNKSSKYIFASKSITQEEEEHLVKWLKNNFLFMDIPDEAFQLVLDNMSLFEVKPETIIFKEGEVGNVFFLIKSGKVEIKGSHKKKMIMKGDSFGELGLINPNCKRIYSAIAKSESELYGMNYDFYQKIIKDRKVQEKKEPTEKLKKENERELKKFFLFKYLPKDVMDNLFFLCKYYEFHEKNQLILSNITSPKHSPSFSSSKLPFFVNPKNIIFPMTGEFIETFHLPEIVKKITKGNAAGVLYTIFKLCEKSEFDIVTGGQKSSCLAITESMFFECLGLNYQSELLFRLFCGLIPKSEVLSTFIPSGLPADKKRKNIDMIFQSFSIKDYKASEIVVPKSTYDNKKFLLVVNGELISGRENKTVLSRGELFGDRVVIENDE